MDYTVVANKLVKKFGDFTAVNQVCFKVHKGEIFGFLGPNGAGKTTTIKMLCGLLQPTSGSGKIAGYDILKEQKKIKQIIGYMSQKFSLYPDLTVHENLKFFGGVYGIGRETMEKSIAKISEMIHLEDIWDYITGDLSLGWKQRLALGSAILHEPKILFLDEPTSGVAPDARRRFWRLINHLAGEGVTVFVTTHYMDEAEYCDRLALINRGEIIAIGSPSEMKDMLKDRIILELITDKLIESLHILEKEKSIEEAAPFGNTIHITVSNEKQGKELTTDLMKKHKIKIISLRKIDPSLEDIFVKLIKEQYAA
jgi:ABC-2 type transport system ATP-binding protein